MMEARAYMGPGPQIIVAIKDGPMVSVYTGIVSDGSISIKNETMDIGYENEMMTHVQPTGRRTVRLEVEFDLDYLGGQMKTWADIKKPEEIDAPKPAIEAD